MTAFVRPTYQELRSRIESDLGALPAVLRVVLAIVWARVLHGVYGFLYWINAQNSPLTCELDRLYDWAELYGVPRLLAKAASGQVLASGDVGTPLLAGTPLRGNNGLDYQVQAAVALGAGNTAVSLRCTSVGSAGNLVAGQTLTLIDPVPGVNSTMTVDVGGLSGGAEDELVEAWRARIADEWVAITTVGARGGKPNDYRYWARSAHQDVTGALVREHVLGIGTVVVRPICNGLVDRLPTQAILDDVSAKFTAIAPAVADWRLTFAALRPVIFSIHLLPAADTAQNRADIQSALNALVLTKGGTDTNTLELLWAEVDATIAAITDQYVLDESVPITWTADEIPTPQPVNWT